MKQPNEKAFSNLLTLGFWLAGGGFGAAILGLFLIIVLGSLGLGMVAMIIAGIGVAAFLVGLVLCIVTLATGVKATRSSAKTPLRYDNVRIVARYAINPHGEMIFDETYIDMDDLKNKFYVRLNVPGVGSHEYRCHADIWPECGESMVGTAVIQGDWIGQFVRVLGDGQGDPYRRS